MGLLGGTFYGTTSGTINYNNGGPTVFLPLSLVAMRRRFCISPTMMANFAPVGDPTLAGSTLYVAGTDSGGNTGIIYAVTVPEPAAVSVFSVWPVILALRGRTGSRRSNTTSPGTARPFHHLSKTPNPDHPERRLRRR